MKKLINYLLIFSATLGFAQDEYLSSYKYEVELGTDNDFLVVHETSDQYYTYGINSTFRWRGNRKRALSRFFTNNSGYFQEVGFYMKAFTPNHKEPDKETNRPYAGWSYFDYKITYGFEKSFIKIGLELGVLGPDSQAGSLQNWFHEHVSGDSVLVGWRNQIKNQLGVNFRGYYAYSFSKSKNFEFYGNVDASLGNVFTFVNPGVNFRIGKFNKLRSTSSHKNNLLGNLKQKEVYFDANLSIKTAIINATIEGDMIDGLNILSAKNVNNFFFNGHLGLYYVSPRWTLGTKYVFSSGEIIDNEFQQYVMLNFNYRFNLFTII